ncbi:hypothetical protein CEE36_08755 [candidate division TA06 bacterium B3_TA06]|uniref:Uncharacterized protein n=1 Tax=candidate division TA06 bacterium B3_TA06 TaxID=2012487 RepID=A0A532V157_UNCT6|nr:MAG: hypothetical protein CEE36_08755 [candidate division TA06 bacterium B3_TA06]
MNKRHFLITYRVRDGEAEYLDHYTVEIADPETDPQDVAKDYLPLYWGDISEDPKHGTPDDPRWDEEAYWDSEMVRLVEVYSIKPISKEDYDVLNRLLVACDITVDTVGRRLKLKGK